MSSTTPTRRGIAGAFVAVMFVTAACGSRTEVSEAPTLKAAVPAVQQPMSADAAERLAQKYAQQRHTPTSADAAERRERQQQSTSTPGPSSADAAERWAQDPRLRD